MILTPMRFIDWVRNTNGPIVGQAPGDYYGFACAGRFYDVNLRVLAEVRPGDADDWRIERW